MALFFALILAMGLGAGGLSGVAYFMALLWKRRPGGPWDKAKDAAWLEYTKRYGP